MLAPLQASTRRGAPFSSAGGRGGGLGRVQRWREEATRLWSGLQNTSALVSQIEDDGFQETMPWGRRAARALGAVMKMREPGTLILIRHGEVR